MKRVLLTSIIAIMAFPLYAQYSGFYRIMNRGAAGRYISIQNTKVSDESKNINYSSGVSVNTAVEALQLIRAKDKDSDAGTILYITGDNDGLTLEAQGMNTQKLLNNLGQGDIKLLRGGKGELYTYVSGYPIYLLDYGFDYPTTRKSTCGVATSSWINKGLETDEKNYIYWTLKKIDNDKEYFGVKPSEGIQIGDKYYTTIYTTFAFQIPESMKAFYIDQYNYSGTPVAELKEITDRKIPASTPVIIECSSSDVSENKVMLLNDSPSSISGNKLKGNVFCYIPEGNEDPKLKNALEYAKSTMRVLGSVNGQLAFVADNDNALRVVTKNGNKEKYIPANKAYLTINAADNTKTAAGIKLLLPDEYAVAVSISKVAADEQVKTGIYTLTGVKVKEDNNSDGLPNGVYIIEGKKQVIK
ncbi:MAG: hypothetical protein IKY01_07330 [Prevotella sp.]|nr:hypothetical protein [Prevotella sp.]MBR5748583.1 hypothetical protein [Prevotella sp.]